MGLANHVDFQAVAHASLFQIGAQRAVEQSHGGEVLHAGKTGPIDIAQEKLHHPEGISSADAGQHRRVPDDREHLADHVHDNRIRVAIGEQPGQRTAAGHAEAARVIDDQQVDAAGFGKLGAQSGAGAAADDGLATLHLSAKAIEDFGAGK